MMTQFGCHDVGGKYGGILTVITVTDKSIGILHNSYSWLMMHSNEIGHFGGITTKTREAKRTAKSCIFKPLTITNVINTVSVSTCQIRSLLCMQRLIGMSQQLTTLTTYLSMFLAFFRCIYIDGLVQQRRNSIANALELRLSCTNPSIYYGLQICVGQTALFKMTDDITRQFRWSGA